MSYTLGVSKEAKDRLISFNLPPEVLDAFQNFLRGVCESPSTFSKAACIPYPPNSQMAGEKFFDLQGNMYFINAFFRFSSDETKLVFFDFGLSRF